MWKKHKSSQSESFLEPITEKSFRTLEENSHKVPDSILKEIRRLAEEYRLFHWHLAFPEVLEPRQTIQEDDPTGWTGGFDCVIGNPPWVRQETLKPIKQLLRTFKSFASTADSSVYFLELGLSICRRLGRVAMLTPNKWFRASYAESLRKVLRERCRIDLLIDFGHSRNLFPDADTFPAAVVVQPVGSPVPGSENARFVQAHDSDRERLPLPELVRSHAVAVPHRSLRPDRWQLEDSAASELLERLLATGRPLEVVLNAPIISGIKSGYNEAFYVSTTLRNALLTADPGSEPLLKKFLRGRDVKRWAPAWDDQWHIVLPSSQNRTWPWSTAASEANAEAIFAATYPLIHAHLKSFEQPLRARQDKGQHWWELRACDYYEEFERPKIVVQCIAYYSQFAFDDRALYVNNKAIVIPTDDLYLLAILNSRVTWWIINRTFQHMKDDGLSVDVQFLKHLPVPTVPDGLRTDISRLALDLITATSIPSDLHKIASLEIEIDGLVDRAFALTHAERQLLLSSLPPRDPIVVLETR